MVVPNVAWAVSSVSELSCTVHQNWFFFCLIPWVDENVGALALRKKLCYFIKLVIDIWHLKILEAQDGNGF